MCSLRAVCHVALTGILGIVGTCGAYGQVAGAPTFEVASVKPSAGPRYWSGFQPQPGGRFEGSHDTVRALVAWAYDIRDFNVSGGPAWAGSDEFDIVAKAAEGSTPEQLRLMMRTLLADRFKLSVRRETKEAALYELAIAKGQLRLEEARGEPGFIGFIKAGQINCQRIDMSRLANYLQTLLGKVVNDKTGLTGLYNFKLSWTPDESQAGKPGAAASATGLEPGPSIFTALQEQLGLRLEPAKGPVDTLVIEHVEKPSAD